MASNISQTLKMNTLSCDSSGNIEEITREHAVIFKDVRGQDLLKYVQAAASVIGANEIYAISRENGTVKIYVKQKRHIYTLLNSGLYIDHNVRVKGAEVGVSKVILNVDPVIPNSSIINLLQRYGSVMSDVLHQKIFNEEEFCHIISSERVIYMKITDFGKFPPSFSLTLNGKLYKLLAKVEFLDNEQINIATGQQDHGEIFVARGLQQDQMEEVHVEQQAPLKEKIPLSCNHLDADKIDTTGGIKNQSKVFSRSKSKMVKKRIGLYICERKKRMINPKVRAANQILKNAKLKLLKLAVKRHYDVQHNIFRKLAEKIDDVQKNNSYCRDFLQCKSKTAKTSSDQYSMTVELHPAEPKITKDFEMQTENPVNDAEISSAIQNVPQSSESCKLVIEKFADLWTVLKERNMLSETSLDCFKDIFPNVAVQDVIEGMCNNYKSCESSSDAVTGFNKEECNFIASVEDSCEQNKDECDIPQKPEISSGIVPSEQVAGTSEQSVSFSNELIENFLMVVKHNRKVGKVTLEFLETNAITAPINEFVAALCEYQSKCKDILIKNRLRRVISVLTENMLIKKEK